jgi:hypothetical protein
MPDVDLSWNRYGGGPVTIQGGADPIKSESLVKGDPLNPVTTLLLGDASKPIATLVLGDPNRPLATLVEGDPTKPIASLLLGDPNKPITLSIKDIPEIRLSTEIGIKPTRIHNPLHFTFCISLFGFEVVTFSICGEAMTIIEPYQPHKAEACM